MLLNHCILKERGELLDPRGVCADHVLSANQREPCSTCASMATGLPLIELLHGLVLVDVHTDINLLGLKVPLWPRHYLMQQELTATFTPTPCAPPYSHHQFGSSPWLTVCWEWLHSFPLFFFFAISLKSVTFDTRYFHQSPTLQSLSSNWRIWRTGLVQQRWENAAEKERAI